MLLWTQRGRAEMPASRNATFSLPEDLFPFLDTLPNKSAYIGALIRDDPEFKKWEKENP